MLAEFMLAYKDQCDRHPGRGGGVEGKGKKNETGGICSQMKSSCKRYALRWELEEES